MYSAGSELHFPDTAVPELSHVQNVQSGAYLMSSPTPHPLFFPFLRELCELRSRCHCYLLLQILIYMKVIAAFQIYKHFAVMLHNNSYDLEN